MLSKATNETGPRTHLALLSTLAFALIGSRNPKYATNESEKIFATVHRITQFFREYLSVLRLLFRGFAFYFLSGGQESAGGVGHVEAGAGTFGVGFLVSAGVSFALAFTVVLPVASVSYGCQR